LLGTPHQRSYLLIGAALALPIVVLVVLQVLFALNRQREDIERDAMARAEQITTLAMARVESDFALMEALATADAVERRVWAAAYTRAREIAEINPHWRNVIISDLDAGEEMFSLRRPFISQRTPISPALTEVSGPNTANRIVGGAWREGPGCPCVYLHLRTRIDDGRYVVSVALDPAMFRSALMRHTPSGSISAIVDARGNFIARSLEQAERVGTPATRYVRDAVHQGGRSGVYAGTTYEGFRNYTAYFRSSAGWSTHIAMSSSLIDRPRAMSFAAVAFGALTALALAAAMIAYALRDLALRRQAEARMAQTQKLEAVGQLTGGVAHDFNNLLTVIIGGLNMLLKRMDDPKQRQIAEHMLEAAQRGDKLTKQLLAFSRGQRLELAPVDLHAMLLGMQELLRRSIDADATLSFSLHPTARWVRSDANQLELAVLNLVINARDAMPDGGRIEIRTAPGRKADTIDLTVVDNGMGMPREVIDRAMEPFFTTKPVGKGTGLGLAQVYGAARQSGGTVDIKSAPGRGARVTLSLPRTEPPRESVLVVDDEPGVRAFMAEALRGAGYAATEADDVGVALRFLQEAPPDLLLTDYSMPGMNGLELAERARARDARLRVLIVSGYADAERIEASAAKPVLLRKPFDEVELLAAVRGVLEDEH
jgi:signal transduction histidine kinase/CheY-like chemotaxis protein